MGEIDSLKRLGPIRSVEDRADIEPPSCEEFNIHIGYTMPSDKAGLERDIGQGKVSPLFYSGRKWSKVYVSSALRVGVYNFGSWGEPGMKRILLAHFGSWIGAEDAIRAMRRISCCAANHVELFALAKASPEMRLPFPVAAVGSSTRDGGRSCAAVLTEIDGERCLSCEDLTMPWPKDTRFMFVRG